MHPKLEQFIKEDLLDELHQLEEVEQTEFDVYLKSFGGQKLQVIKAIKQIIGLGLKESKDLVDSAPCVICSGVMNVEAETLRTELENVGATVEIR